MPEPSPSVSPPGSPPGVAAGGMGSQMQGAGGPPTGNLPPAGAPSSTPVQKLGLEARGAEVVRGALTALSLAFPMLGAGNKRGMAVMKAIQALSKEFAQEEQQGGNQQALMQAMQRAQMRQGGGARPGAGPPPMPMQGQGTPGPAPAMT